jgi:hypothetical protein
MDEAPSYLTFAWNGNGSHSRETRTGCRERPLTATTHYPTTTDQTTKLYENGSTPADPAGKGSAGMEASSGYRSAGDASQVASPGLSPLLEAEVKTKVDASEGDGRDHCVDQGDGKAQSPSSERNGSGANYSSWVCACANARSKSTCGVCARLDHRDRTGEPFSAIIQEKCELAISSR